MSLSPTPIRACATNRLVWVLVSILLLTTAGLPSLAQSEVDQEIETCMVSHADKTSVAELGDGTKPSLAVDVGLFKKSGHYQNYHENMFFTEVDEREFGVKPMNCPGRAGCRRALRAIGGRKGTRPDCRSGRSVPRAW